MGGGDVPVVHARVEEIEVALPEVAYDLFCS